MIDYENHPAAELFPMMTDAEIQSMADDIKQNGLREPIQLFQGKILDGRNRFLACKRAAIEANFTNLNGNCPSPVAFVMSKNLHRRHLKTEQRAAIAAEALPMLEEEARKRQGSRTDLVEKSTTSTSGRKRPEVIGRSAAIAGQLLDVGKTSVKIAARVKRQDPETFEQMKRGEISIVKAREKVAGKGIRQGQLEKAQAKYFEEYLGRILGASRGMLELKANLIASQLDKRQIKQRWNEYGQSSRKVRGFIRQIQQQKEKNRGQQY